MPPFPKAHWYIAGFMLVTFAAFLPSYYSVLPDAPWVHHLHGVTATLWILLVVAQNRTAHRGRYRAHAILGAMSLALVPIFTVGGLLVTQNTLLKESAFKALFGTALSAADLLVSVAFVAFYTLALRHRRTPALHARYMLATIILLVGPSLSRFFANYIPGFLVRGPESLPNFGAALDASFALTCLFCLVLIARDGRDRQPLMPFSLALGGTIAMVLGYYIVGYSEAYQPIAQGFADLPAWQIMVFALVSSSAPIAWAWAYPAARQATSGAVTHQMARNGLASSP